MSSQSSSSLDQFLTMLQDPHVSEIMINSPKEIFFEQDGKMHRAEYQFGTSEEVIDLIKKMAIPAGGQSWSDPIVSARMKDGSRVHAVFSPVVLGQGPSVTIRKFLPSKLTLKALVQSRSMSEDMGYFLTACVQARLNLVVAGGTSSGKTSLLNALSTCIDPQDRMITIEDTAELKLRASNIVRMECQVSQGKAVTLRELLLSALRMRPDRIIVGETRGPECFDMLQAMNTGHEGSMTTIHANSPRDCLARIESMSLIANTGIPSEALRRQIASAVDMIIQLQKLRDGSRKVVSISEVGGMEGNTILTQEIFQYVDMGEAVDKTLLGKFVATGIVPRCMSNFKSKGIQFPKDFFSGAYHVDMDMAQSSQMPVRVKARKP